ncbi:Abi family protein [Leifsonia sp. NPDC058292]|uniref:Abi family protein n=1 Tax=Leifsonia sp. NPDC058292 TaxID=3346428 RepID=UPI0036DEEA25
MPKPPLTLPEQLALVRHRGLQAGESDMLVLYSHNYYRLSGYWRYFQRAPQDGDDSYESGTAMVDVMNVYRFDLELRNILLEGLSEVEIAVRSRLAYRLAICEAGEQCYLMTATYRSEVDGGGTDQRARLLQSIAAELDRSKERFVTRYRSMGIPIPIWTAVEALSFGTVSKMYRLLADEPIREQMAKEFELGTSTRLDTTLRSMSVLRNVCAHHGRIWNRVPTVPPFVLKSLRVDYDKSIYHQTPWAWFAVLAHLVSTVRRDSSFGDSLFSFVDDFPQYSQGLKHPHNR